MVCQLLPKRHITTLAGCLQKGLSVPFVREFVGWDRRTAIQAEGLSTLAPLSRAFGSQQPARDKNRELPTALKMPQTKVAPLIVLPERPPEIVPPIPDKDPPSASDVH